MAKIATSRAGPNKAEAGFTLLEMLVVLTILGLITAQALPAFYRMLPGFRLQADLRAARTIFAEARAAAIQGYQETVVTVNVETGTLGMTGSDRQVQFASDVGMTLVTATTELAGSDAGGIRFYPDGTSTGGRLTIVRDEAAHTIIVDWITGQASIDE